MTKSEHQPQTVAVHKGQAKSAKIKAAIQRGRGAADAGQMSPAREALEKLRIRHNIPK